MMQRELADNIIVKKKEIIPPTGKTGHLSNDTAEEPH